MSVNLNRYIKRFDTEAEFIEFLYSDEYENPNISYVNRSDVLHINETQPLMFTAEQANSTIKLTKSGSPDAVSLKYSTDGSTWNSYSIDTIITLANIGDYVMFKGNNDHFSKSLNDFYKFIMSGRISASKDVTSLMKLIGGDCNLTTYCYSQMFQDCTSLTTAPSLPSTTLADGCYYGMFSGCTSLTTAPELPATTLASNCYKDMFESCTSLTTAPKLPATTLANYCYREMFKNCTSLTTAPKLPATTLANYCYAYMFRGCTSLTTAPSLPSTTLAINCYYGMFQRCTSLTTVPELPATTLAQYCYSYMFYDCINLNYIKAMFTTTPGKSYTTNWVYRVSPTGIFVKNSTAGWNVTGNSGIPSNWTVQNAAA